MLTVVVLIVAVFAFVLALAAYRGMLAAFPLIRSLNEEIAKLRDDLNNVEGVRVGEVGKGVTSRSIGDMAEVVAQEMRLRRGQ